MPVSATITSFYVFTPGERLKDSSVNLNFGLFRGHLVSIDPFTATAASSREYSLGSNDKRWQTVFADKLDVSLTSTAQLVVEANTSGQFQFVTNSVPGFLITPDGFYGYDGRDGDNLSFYDFLTNRQSEPKFVAVGSIGDMTDTGIIFGSTCTVTSVGRPVVISGSPVINNFGGSFSAGALTLLIDNTISGINIMEIGLYRADSPDDTTGNLVGKTRLVNVSDSVSSGVYVPSDIKFYDFVSAGYHKYWLTVEAFKAYSFTSGVLGLENGNIHSAFLASGAAVEAYEL